MKNYINGFESRGYLWNTLRTIFGSLDNIMIEGDMLACESIEEVKYI